ncbi:hypothetical protein SLA2020_457370 [Shorea laevis]
MEFGRSCVLFFHRYSSSYSFSYGCNSAFDSAFLCSGADVPDPEISESVVKPFFSEFVAAGYPSTDSA